MKHTYIALDIDGTVFDAADIVVPAFQQGIECYAAEHGEAGFHMPTKDEIVVTLGLPMDEIFYRLFPDFSLEKRRMLMDQCTDSFVELIEAGEGIFFDGVKDTVISLHEKGYKFVVASNGMKAYCEAILKTYGIFHCFSEPMIYLNEDILDKTAIVAAYKKELIDADLIVMVGDRYTDRDAAEINNIPFIACSFGHADSKELQGCRWTVHSFAEIPQALSEIETCTETRENSGKRSDCE